MALIDDLLARITDSTLRDELSRAVSDLRDTRAFGLVFENHAPETVGLSGLPLPVGALVRPRTETGGDGVYRLVSTDGTDAVIQSLEGDASKRTVPKVDLQVVKRFGDPIYPALESAGSVTNGPEGRPYHAAINGENYHVLQLLTYLYAGQVDCIYIDPPYNSGAKDWKYNNRYVDDKDVWRHSKWLSFIQKRLALAKMLLKPNGVLIVTIDKNEHNHLGVLLEQEFKQHDITSVCIVHNPRGAQGDNFSYTNEFALFVTPQKQKVIAERPLVPDTLNVTGTISTNDAPVGDKIVTINASGFRGAATTDARGRFRMIARDDDNDGDHLRNWGGESSRYDAANCFYPILVKDGKIVGFGGDRTNDETWHPPHDEDMGDGVVAVWPINNGGEEKKWRYARQTVESIRNMLSVKYMDGVPQIMLKKISGKHKTVWIGSRYDANTNGSQIVKRMTGNDFPYPKSVLAVRDTLYAVVASNPNALILDFFAGSGTTFHATCLLNEEDGGARRCVLVTNNEVSEDEARRLRRASLFPGDTEYEKHGIFESVTVPRCKAVVLGRNAAGEAIEGDVGGRALAKPFDENLEFFNLRYLDPDQVDLGSQYKAIVPSIWLSAGGVGAREHVVEGKSYSCPSDSTYAVLLDERFFRSFVEAVKMRKNLRRVWIVTDSDEAFAEMRSKLPGHLDVSMLYRDYLRTFTINTRLVY